MSLKGQILRGEKWYNNGEYVKDKNVTGDPNKMKNINAYLNSIKKEKKVEEPVEEKEEETKSKRKK